MKETLWSPVFGFFFPFETNVFVSNTHRAGLWKRIFFFLLRLMPSFLIHKFVSCVQFHMLIVMFRARKRIIQKNMSSRHPDHHPTAHLLHDCIMCCCSSALVLCGPVSTWRPIFASVLGLLLAQSFRSHANPVPIPPDKLYGLGVEWARPRQGPCLRRHIVSIVPCLLPLCIKDFT